MAKAPNYLRVGKTVLHRNQIRHQLASEVQQLVGRIEILKRSPLSSSSQVIQSYETMIQDRCSVLAKLSDEKVLG